MVKGFFEQLGCQESRVYDVGTTEWGAQGNPVVYAKCDEGAPRTLLIYWMYDTMPVTQPDVWVAPPFEGRLVEQAPFKKVMIGRGTNNSKGGQMAQLERADGHQGGRRQAAGEPDRRRRRRRRAHVDRPAPVRQGPPRAVQGRRSAVARRRPELRPGAAASAPATPRAASTSRSRPAARSGAAGPTVSDIHGGNKRSVDSPAWRHIKMLASLISDDGNTAKVDGFYDDAIPFDEAADGRRSSEQAEFIDMEEAAREPRRGAVHRRQPGETTCAIATGFRSTWTASGAGTCMRAAPGAILPNKITSKHNIRYVPNMKGPDLVEKIKKQLVKNGYPDVEVKIIGDVPWRAGDARGRPAEGAGAGARHLPGALQQAEGARDR